METEQAVAASSADADAGGSGLKSWERVWSLDELKASSMGGRSLASDLGLLNFLKDFSGQLREQTKLLENQVTELVQSADSAKIRLHNTFNHFLQLSHTQYMENRVYDEDVANISREGDAAGSTAGASSSSSSNSSSTGGENRPRTHEELEALLMPKYTEAIQLGVTALLNAPTFVELDDFGLMAQAAASSSTADLSLSGVDGSSANNNTNANKASVRYDWETPLPHVIGTREFQEEEFCGLWVPPPEPEPEDQQLDDLSADHFSEEDYESDGPLHNQDGDLIPDLPAGASPTTEALLAPPVLPKKNAIKAQEDDDDDDDDEAESRSDDGEEEEEEDVSEEEDEESEVSEDEEESGDDEWDDQPKVKKSRKTRKGKKQVAAAVPKAPMSFQEQLAASLVGQMRGEGAPLPSMIKKSGSTKKTKKTTGTRGKQPDNSTTSGDAAGKAEEGRKQGEGEDEDDAAEQEAAAAPIKAKTGLSLFDSLSVADDDDLDAMLLGASTASKAKAPVSKTSAATTTGSAAAGKPKSAFSLDDLDLDLDDPDALFVVPVVGAKKPQTTSTAAAPKSQAGGANKLSLLDSLSLGGDDDLDDGQALFAPAVPKPAAKTAAPPAVAKKPMAATAEPATAAKKGPSSLMDFSLDDDLDDGFLSTVSIPKKTAATPTSSAPPSKTNSGALSFDLDGDDDGELFSLAAAAKPSTAAAKPAAPASKTTTKPAAPAGLFDFGDGLDEDDGEFGFALGSAAKKPAAPTPTAAAPKPASPAPATTKSNANSLLSPFGPDDDGEDELFSLGGAAAAKPATPTPAAKPATPTPTAAAPKPASATTKSNVNSLLSPFGPDDDGEDELFSLGSAAAAKPATPTPAAKQTTPARVQSPAPTTATDDLFDFPSPATRTAASPAPPKPAAAAAAPTTTATAPDDLFDFPSPAAAPKPAEAAPPAANKQPASRKSTGPSDLFDEDGGDMFDFPSIGSKPAAQQQQTKTVQFQAPEPPKQPSSQEQPTRARAGSRIAELQGKLDLNVGTLLPGSAPIKPHVDTSSFDLSEESTPTARSSTNSNNSSPARPLQHLTKDRAQTAKKRPPTRGKRAPTSRTTQTTTTTPTPAVKTTATAATTTAPPDLFELPDFVPVKTAAPAAAATRGGLPAMAKGADVLGALDGFDSFFDAPTGKTEEQLRVAEAAKYSHPTAQKERIKAAQVEQTRQAALARMEQDKARVQEEQRAAAAARAQKQREEEEEKQRLDAQKRAEDERRAAAAPKPTTTTTKADDGGFDLDDLLAPVVLQKKPRSVDVDDIFAMPAPAPAATKTAGPDIFSSPSPAAAKPASRPAFVFDDSGDLFADPLAEKKKPARSFDIDSFFS